MLDLGHGAKSSLFKDIEVTELNVNDTRHEVTYTSEVIWPLGYGDSGHQLGILWDAPERSFGPITVLGVLNPLITIGHATVKRDRAVRIDRTSYALEVVEASQCILHPCEKQVSVTKANGTTRWNVDLTNFGNLVARIDYSTFRQ